MPTLTTLALQGASCFSARTVTPPLTLPAHTSMLRGVGPASHGVTDNAMAALRTDAPTFLRAARDAARSTATCISWLPLDGVIEREAVTQRFTIDGGYDPDSDRQVVDASISAISEARYDLVFAYLIAPDLAGHGHGWDSAEYLTSVALSDAALARLVDAAGPHANVLVTTDHGGLGSGHGDPVPEVMDTFVVVRAPSRIRPASGWPTASILDVAPTVADLCGIAADRRWEGTSLVGRELPLTDNAG